MDIQPAVSLIDAATTTTMIFPYFHREDTMKRHITFFIVTISALFISCSESNEQTVPGQAGEPIGQRLQVAQTAAPEAS